MRICPNPNQDSVSKYLEFFFGRVVAPVVEQNLLVFSETFGAFVLPHCVDPVPDPQRREKESDMAQLIATFDRFGYGFLRKLVQVEG